jgi:hypothetical protein
LKKRLNANRQRLVWVATLFCATFAQAARPVEKNWVIERSTSHALCPWSAVGPVARVLTSAQQWSEVVFKAEEVALNAPVDWQTQDVLVFALGTQPHLGVTVKLAKRPSPLRLQGEIARLQVQLLTPPPGSNVAMARARPCVMAVVRKRPWHQLEVRQAQSGEVLWRGQLNEKGAAP